MKVIYDNGTKVDDYGNVLEYAGKRDYGVWLDYTPIPKGMIESVVDDILFPVEKLSAIKLINFPFRLMVYVNGWQGIKYNGRAYFSHIIYGARGEKIVTKESIGALVIHELGHALMYLACECKYEDHMNSPKFKEYIKLRKIPSNFTPKSQWAFRPAEIFAEDFRWIFGLDYMKFLDTHPMEHIIGLPNEDIRKFMLDLAEDIEGGIDLDNFKDTKGHWGEQVIDEATDLGIVNGYLDMTFKPDNPVTRAEATAMCMNTYKAIERLLEQKK